MMNPKDTHELITDTIRITLFIPSILDAIAKHPNAQPHLMAHALITIGVKLARDSAPTPADAKKLIDLALED